MTSNQVLLISFHQRFSSAVAAMQDGAVQGSGSGARSGPGEQATPRIVVVGAGFAGMEVAKALQGAPARVTLIDRHNYTLFQPLLYQVATAAVSPADVAAPIRALLHGFNIEILLDELVAVEIERSCVRMASGRRAKYDLLVLATGSQYDYFGHEDWTQLAPAPKGLTDAVEIRRRLLLAFERAEMCEHEEDRRAFVTFVVVGAGPTGVEMAGAIAELAKSTLHRDFRRIRPAEVRIFLVEAGQRALNGFPAGLGRYAERALGRLGIEILFNSTVDRIDSEGVVASGRRIAARTVIWAAGVRATPVAEWLRVKPARHHAVRINPDFSVPGLENVFVVGDAAEAIGRNGEPLPGLAAVAKQEGRYLGTLLKRRLHGDSMAGFRYRDYRTMATIGRSAAVADLRGFRLTGTKAWLLWGVVHLYYLIGFRNRLVVLVNWFWQWLTYGHGARLITGEPRSNTVERSSSEPPMG